ncbi:MAG: hypothetical protein ACTSVI_07205 [Promethearchaeota archaeon]
MNNSELEEILFQKLGFRIKNENDFLIFTFQDKFNKKHDMVIYFDDDSKSTIASVRIDVMVNSQFLMKKLLRENMRLQGLKYALDKEERVLIIAEIPEIACNDENLKKTIFKIVQATEKLENILH